MLDGKFDQPGCIEDVQLLHEVAAVGLNRFGRERRMPAISEFDLLQYYYGRKKKIRTISQPLEFLAPRAGLKLNGSSLRQSGLDNTRACDLTCQTPSETRGRSNPTSNPTQHVRLRHYLSGLIPRIKGWSTWLAVLCGAKVAKSEQTLVVDRGFVLH